jgi:hypothetical protein
MHPCNKDAQPRVRSHVACVALAPEAALVVPGTPAAPAAHASWFPIDTHVCVPQRETKVIADSGRGRAPGPVAIFIAAPADFFRRAQPAGRCAAHPEFVRSLRFVRSLVFLYIQHFCTESITLPKSGTELFLSARSGTDLSTWVWSA